MATPNMAAPVSLTPTLLVATQIAVNTDSAVYTVPANRAVRIVNASVCNVSGAAVTIGVSLVKSGGVVGDGTHKIVPDTYPLAAGDTLPLKDLLADHVLGDGDIIAMHASAANTLDVVISGIVMA